MPEPVSFVSTRWLKPLFAQLQKIQGAREREIDRIGNVFGNPLVLAQYYVEPECQQRNPADRDEDEHAASVVRSPVFRTMNDFLDRELLLTGGHNQMFVLSDAGMGKTSLLMMIKLMHLMAFWPKGYDCELLKLGPKTLEQVRAVEARARTILLLDALDEDPGAWGVYENRLLELLSATKNFRRVLISCRTQFFPDHEAGPFGKLGQVEVGGFVCPMIFLAPFDDEQVSQYLEKRFPRRWRDRLVAKDHPQRQRAEPLVASMQSLRFRPMLLAHIEDILESAAREWTEYALYEALVASWLNREEAKLREQIADPPTREELWDVCAAIAAQMQEAGVRTLDRTSLDALAAEHPAIRHLEYFDPGGRSLLNRNSDGAFRFSHYSIQEFLVVHGVMTGLLPLDGPYRLTNLMGNFRDHAAQGELSGRSLRALASLGFDLGRLARRIFLDPVAGGGLGPEMVLLPAGRIPEQEGRSVWAIPRPFAIGKYPVTFGEYERFAEATGRRVPYDSGWGKGRRPVINVSLHDAEAYAAWLSDQTGETYHVPSKAEWDYAAEGEVGRTYPWGEQVPTRARANFDARETSPVDNHPSGATPDGVMDMAGNVFEWTGTRALPEAVPLEGVPDDLDAQGAFVLRSGSFDDEAEDLRAAYRGNTRPVGGHVGIGFRVVWSLRGGQD